MNRENRFSPGPADQRNQAALRHPERSIYRCFLTDLAGFIDVCRAGPDYADRQDRKKTGLFRLSLGTPLFYSFGGQLSIIFSGRQTFGDKAPVSALERGLACHPERSEGSGSPNGRSFASLRMTSIISKCLSSRRCRLGSRLRQASYPLTQPSSTEHISATEYALLCTARN